MDMLAINSGISMYDNSWPIYARTPVKPPHVTGPNARCPTLWSPAAAA